MKDILPAIKKSPLFYGIDENELLSMLACLSAIRKSYDKNEYIYRAGEAVTTVGIVCCGSVQVIKEDFWGNRAIISQLTTGDSFGEAFSCAQVGLISVSVVAAEQAEVLLLDYKKIITTCSSNCTFHSHLIQNMLKILANKNIELTQKVEHMSKRTTREKLLSYLSAEAMKRGSNVFEIPFNRQELADYLSVDRSAMCNELSKLRAEGLLSYKRNHFELTF
ncbi:MAG: Crp/Fnr family transcriptional regulator [Firmicutes bacterium]|nr:Crp/Fnr family transcriptional regulator [Bacillota bacterium]